MIFGLIKGAKELLFNNENSSLKATNVQDAIDELSSGFKVYNDPSEFGCSSYVFKDILKTMPDNSMLISNAAYYGGTNRFELIDGLLRITRYMGDCMLIEVVGDAGAMATWYGSEYRLDNEKFVLTNNYQS